MDQKMIFEKVKEALVSTCRIEPDDVSPEKTLIEELNIDSIDLIDLLYTLETEFNISIKISEFENFAQNEMGGKPFSVNNIVTDEGLAALKRAMPEIPVEKLKPGLSVSKIPYLITVQSLCNIVEKKLGK